MLLLITSYLLSSSESPPEVSDAAFLRFYNIVYFRLYFVLNLCGENV